jgi:hypothetical protein
VNQQVDQRGDRQHDQLDQSRCHTRQRSDCGIEVGLKPDIPWL